MFSDRYCDESDIQPIVDAVGGARHHVDPDGLCCARLDLAGLPDDQSLNIDVHESGLHILHMIADDGYQMQEYVFEGMRTPMAPEDIRRAVGLAEAHARASGITDDNADDYHHRVRHYSGESMEMTDEDVTP